ncbi:ATP-dependent transcriptional regulator [Oceanicola sp. 22II-s10i]|uniref:DUF2927 domain-containing protein n=1 Tax=Oceanicola sp. 22II-s10i TaxID=1317116 RepID=UPI000B51F61D|nr:DUF2927 domain-containing protein [Oceanicola sp. 22II-s10i]OWU83716.1 ATP-dependent transcriptional regulator [Oceanicola sp. 22II-s10i]
MKLAFAPVILALTVGCQPMDYNPEPASRAAAAPAGLQMQPMKLFSEARGGQARITQSNSDIARDFLDLTFMLESGRALPVLTRFEEPIRVRISGAPPAGMTTELDRVLKRMRGEADIDIQRTSGEANVIIQAVSSAQIRKHLPQAACFVVPNVTSLSDYAAARRNDGASWTTLTERKRIAIFVPNDVSPQEVRDCLHEELAQAIGPLNDLYRLDSSVFNDDNIHTVLTSFDMLILRAYYDPRLHSGMTRDEVAARLPEILARLNPAGANRGAQYISATPRPWIEAIQTALGPGASAPNRLRAAQRALDIAIAQGWNDHRLAFSHYALGRLVQARDPAQAVAHYRSADIIYARSGTTAIHRAFVRTQLAAHSLARGDASGALRTLRGQAELARRYENAALLASIQMLEAEALDYTGDADQARKVRRDSIGWARYGFGPDWAVRAKLSEVAALNPKKTGGS